MYKLQVGITVKTRSIIQFPWRSQISAWAIYGNSHQPGVISKPIMKHSFHLAKAQINLDTSHKPSYNGYGYVIREKG